MCKHFRYWNSVIFVILVERNEGDFESNSVVKPKIPDPRVKSSKRSLNMNKLKWLGHVLGMPTE